MEQRKYIPFGDFSPDLSNVITWGEDASSHLLMALNSWALGTYGYRPSSDLEDTGIAAIAGKPSGSSVFDPRWLYYGTQDGRIIEIDYDSLTAEVKYTAPSSGFVTIQSWRENNSLATFTDITADVNDPGANDAQPFPAGSGADDAVYFGYSVEQKRLSPNVGTAGVGTYTVTWEYSQGGTSWGALENVDDFTDAFKNSGSNNVRYDFPEDWQASSVGGVTAFYIRARRDGGTVTTDPILTQVAATFTHAREWSMTRFGDVTIATNEFDPVQVQTVRDNDFSDLITSTDKPQAKYISTFGDRIVLANIKTVATTDLGPRGNYRYTIWYSGRNAANNFDVTDAVDRPGFQTLPSNWGEITGLAEVSDYLLIFFERAIYRMSPGGFLGFSYLPVVQGKGTRHYRSIAVLGNAAYFWDNGPSSVNASGFVDIAADKLSNALLLDTWPIEVQLSVDTTSGDPIRIIGTALTDTGDIVWSYPVTDASYESAVIAWNYRTRRFSVPILHRQIVGEDNEILLLESRGDVVGSWEFGSRLAIGVYDATAEETTFRQLLTTGGGELGDSAYVGPARFQLAYLEIASEPVVLTAISIVASPLSDATLLPAFSVTIRSKDDPSDPNPTEVTFTTADSKVTMGWMSLLSDVSSVVTSVRAARYHSIDLEITPSSSWRGAEVQGVMVRWESAGDYGA